MNIYISNLSFNVDSNDLKDLFSEYGVVESAKVIMDRETGKSKGFGFVEMPSEEEGNKAIQELNQAKYDGKVINVSIARPKTENPQGERRGFGGGERRSGGFGGGERRSGGFGGGERRSGGFGGGDRRGNGGGGERRSGGFGGGDRRGNGGGGERRSGGFGGERRSFGGDSE